MNTLRSTLFATVTFATIALAAPSAFAMMMMPMGGAPAPAGGMMMDQMEMPMPSGGQMGNTPQPGMQQPGMQQQGTQQPQADGQQQTQSQPGFQQPQQQAAPQQGMMMNPQQMQTMPGMNQPGMQMQPGQPMMQMGQQPGPQMMNAMPAVAGAQAAQYQAPQVQVPPTPAAQATAWTYSRLVNNLNQPLTGAPDVDFLQGMMAQHEAAIDIARIELLHGTNPDVRKIAEQVITSHETELQTLKTQAWGQAASIQPVDPTAPAADQSAHSTHVIK